jgi:Protein of unknown function (DUF3574)
MRSSFLAVFSFILLLATGHSAGAQTPTPPCHGTQQTKMVAELLFGRNIGRTVGVSESEWAGFVAREMAPRFPDGLTITDAVGERRDPDTNSTAEEPSKHVEIVLPGNPDDEARLDAVVAAYKREFRQQSVGVIVRPACVSF